MLSMKKTYDVQEHFVLRNLSKVNMDTLLHNLGQNFVTLKVNIIYPIFDMLSLSALESQAEAKNIESMCCFKCLLHAAM